MKLMIVHAKAPSLSIVASHIAKVARAMGHDVKVSSDYIHQDFLFYRPNAILWIFPVNTTMSSRYAGQYSTNKVYAKSLKQVWYGTAEGTPYGEPSRYPVWYNIDFIANSMYTANKLNEVGYHVLDIVHHAYDPDENREAIEYAEFLRKKIEHDFPNKVIFAIAEGSHMRKGWHKLVDALNKIPENIRSKFVILAIADKSTVDKVLPNAPKDSIYVVGQFGQMARKQVLALFKIADYVLVPSLAEGFGLPVLEANSLGRLAIFVNMEPFNEFADVKANITFPWDNLKEIVDNGVEFELHDYDPQYLADAIVNAVDMAKSGEYEERSKRAYDAVKDMTITNLYTKIVKYIE
jgi:glycosyltransferase involved in cell wall biosynthesis